MTLLCITNLAYSCPDAGGLMNYARPQIKCEICGDMGHVTMDCKMAKPGDFKILNTLNGTRYPTSTFHSGGISLQPKQQEPQVIIQCDLGIRPLRNNISKWILYGPVCIQSIMEQCNSGSVSVLLQLLSAVLSAIYERSELSAIYE